MTPRVMPREAAMLGGGLRPPSEASPRRRASRRTSWGWGPTVRGEQSEKCAGEAGARSGTLLLARTRELLGQIPTRLGSSGARGPAAPPETAGNSPPGTAAEPGPV